MSDQARPAPALLSPAIAKWQFVEEKARAVLDAFCHREVRPLDLHGGQDLVTAMRTVFASTGALSAATEPTVAWHCLREPIPAI